MCSGGGIATGLGVVSNIFQAQASAEAQYNAQLQEYYNAQARWGMEKQQLDDRQKMLTANAILQLQQLQARQQEVNDAAVTDKAEISLAALQAKAAAELSAGEANVSGRSVDQILGSIESEAQRRTANVESTRGNQVSAAQMDKHNTIQSAQTLPIYAVLPSMPEYDNSGVFSAALSGLGNLDFSGIINSRNQGATTRCGK